MKTLTQLLKNTRELGITKLIEEDQFCVFASIKDFDAQLTFYGKVFMGIYIKRMPNTEKEESNRLYRNLAELNNYTSAGVSIIEKTSEGTFYKFKYQMPITNSPENDVAIHILISSFIAQNGYEFLLKNPLDMHKDKEIRKVESNIRGYIKELRKKEEMKKAKLS